MTAGAGPETDPALAGRHVTVCSVYYAPEQTGIAPYTTALAEHLAGRGADVEVVAGFPHYPDWRVFDGYRAGWRRRESQGPVTVVRRRQFTPRRHNGPNRALYELSWLLTGVARRAPRTDAVIAVTPSLAGAALAWETAARHRAPFGVLVQDLTGPAAQQSGVTSGSLIPRAARAAEGTLFRGADAVAVVSRAFIPYLTHLGVRPERIHEVRNWSRSVPPLLDKETARRRAGFPGAATVVLHAGNMGAKQSLETVVEAAALARSSDPHVRFVLMGDGNQRPRLEELGRGLSNLSIIPLRSPDDYPVALAAADVLLVNERATVLDMSLPSKLTSYFMAGRPVLAAVRPDGATAAEITASGGGLVVAPGDAEALVAGVRKLAADPTRAARLGASARSYALTELSASASLSAADAFVDRLLQTRSRGKKPAASSA